MSKNASITSQKVKTAAGFPLFMLTVAYTLNFLDRQILVILQEQIKLEIGLSDMQLGLLSGFAFALVYVAVGIPIAYLADRSNRRNILTVSIAVWSGMTALTGLATSYSQLLMARVGVALGEAGGTPPAHSMISDYYPPEKRATALSIYSTGIHFGVIIGFLLGGYIGHVLGWRMAFFAVGLPGLLFALIFYITVKEPIRGNWEAKNTSGKKPTMGEALIELNQYKSFRYLTLGAAFSAFVAYGSTNFMPSFLIRSHGLSVSEVSLVLAAVMGTGGIIGTLGSGYLADKLAIKDKRWYLWVPAITAILVVLLGLPYLLLNDTYQAIGFLFLILIAMNCYFGSCLAIAHSLVEPTMRALVSAILLFVINIIGLGLGPVLAGFLSDHLTGIYGSDGLRYALVVINMVSFIAIAFYLLAAKHLKSDLDKKSRINS